MDEWGRGFIRLSFGQAALLVRLSGIGRIGGRVGKGLYCLSFGPGALLVYSSGILL